MVVSQSFSSLATTIKRRRKSIQSLPTFLRSLSPRKLSFKGILTETWLVANLAVQLLLALGSRLVWIWMFFRFLIYVSLLMPAFVRAGWVFMISDYIKRSIKYGPNPRNYLDIYPASDIMTRQQHDSPTLDRRSSSHEICSDNKYPVVVFLSGGAWIIGYKAWGCFMGMLLAQLGVIFVSPDYRNFPQGTINDMVTDATNAIQWVQDNIHKYGGDKDNMYVISQSAGAHIGALMMLMQARKVEIYKKLKSYLIQLKHYKKQTQATRSKNRKHVYNESDKDMELNQMIQTVEDKLMSDEYDSLWNPQKDLKAFVGIAGPYNMEDMKDYLDRRGLYCDIIYKIMENDLRRASPFYCLYDLFISSNDNKRKLKPLNRIDSTDPHKPFISMTEIDFDKDSLKEPQDVNVDEMAEGGKAAQVTNYEMKMDIHEKRPSMNMNDILEGKVELNLPAMYLFHGENDVSCPVSNTKTFSLALANYGVKTFIKIYANKSHTAPIIEDPISGKDPLVCDMLQIIYPDQSLTKIVEEIEGSMTGGLRLPKVVIDLASFVCPF